MRALHQRDVDDQAYNHAGIKAHEKQVALRKWQEKKLAREERLEKLLAVVWRAYPEVEYAEDGNGKSFTLTWYDDDEMSDLL